jgi:hypothetical protein
MPTRSILPNSAPHILLPMTGAHGTLQVTWHADLDSHVLWFGDSPIASHHNGYSCHLLAERILKVWAGERDVVHALEQHQYILRCGGMACSVESFLHIACLGQTTSET